VRVAQQNGVTLRLIGGLAIRMHCHGEHSEHTREYHDIDVFGFKRESEGIVSVFEKLGYDPNTEYNLLYGENRLQFLHAETRKNVDVFLDKFRMDHTIDIGQHLELDDLTIPVTDLLLTKLQIARLTEKDAKDIIAILEDHEIGRASNKETLDVEYLARRCAHNWGLQKTVTDSLSKIRKIIQTSEIKGGKDLVRKIETIENEIAVTGKGLRWMIRSLFGERLRWYEKVEIGQGEAY
jgi:hypothetical protein